MNERKIIVIGGGPAGIMAAIRASQLNQNLTLVEKNPILGKKLLLSGKGRCNLTNSCDLAAFLVRFSKNGQFLRDAFKKFFNKELMTFFEKRGLRLKVERQMRVFPVTNKSGGVINVLRKGLLKNNVKILYKRALKDIIMQKRQIKGIVVDSGKFIPCEKLILATGGISYGFTGSTGEGLNIAKRLGHTIVALKPGLVPLVTRQKYPDLNNLTLENIRLKFSDAEKQIISDIGELLFTKFGISGALVLSLSGRIVDWMAENKHIYVEIDLKPALSKGQVDGRLLREFKANPKKSIKIILNNMLPAKMINIFLDMAKINPDKPVSQIIQQERKNMVALFKGVRFDIFKSLPIEEAMITRGGISLNEINPRTMESRLVKGLYFCGEMIDIDADTGGFNLQAAFSTGYLAGESASLS